jgi:ADP-dependent NAD(P)H-hydrate dehydratase
VPPAEVVTPQLLRQWALPEVDDGGDKNARGTVLVAGGSASTPGALLLTGLAALRTGAGKLQMVTVEATSVALAVSVPEAGVTGVGEDPLGEAAADEVVARSERATAVVLGPGLMDKDGALALLRAVLPRLEDTPVVLDGLALTALAGQPDLLSGVAAVLTPNSGELAALLDGQELEGLEAAAEVARRYGAVVSSPGWVAAPDDRCWRVEAGGIGLGTSGSGDVLAGLVGGVLARGASPEQAAAWGQYLHSAAGDQLTARIGRVGFLARELLDEVPTVLGTLRR